MSELSTAEGQEQEKSINKTNKENKESSFFIFLTAYWKEFLLIITCIAGYSASLLLKVPEIIAFTGMLAFTVILFFTSIHLVWGAFFIAAGAILALVLSDISYWRIILIIGTIAMPFLYAIFLRCYPKKVSKLILNFSEEAAKMKTREEIAVAASRSLKNAGFFKNTAILIEDKNSDELVIIGGTPSYDADTRVKRDNSLAWRSFITGKTTVTYDAQRDEFLPSRIKPAAAAAVPLAQGGKLFGVIQAETEKVKKLKKIDREILILFSVMLSFALFELENRDNIKNSIRG